MCHGHFAKTLSEAPSLMPAHLRPVAGLPGSWLWTHRWLGRILESCGSFVTAIGRGGDLETALHMVVVPGTPVDTVGSKEVQTSVADTLCSQHLPQALFVH